MGAAGELPRGRDLERSVMRVTTAAGFATGILVIAFLVPVIQLSPSQLRVTGICVAIAAVLFTLLGNALQTPRIQRISRYLDARGRGPVETDVLRKAFAEVMNFPRFTVLFTFFGQWVAMALLISGVLFVTFETFSAESAMLTATAGLAGGFLSQIMVYTRIRLIFAPLRDVLAREIPDPAERARLVAPVPIQVKIFVAMAGLMITSSLFSAALGQGRATRTIEGFATGQQRAVLDLVQREFEATGDLEAALDRSDATLAPLQIQLLTLDPSASEITRGARGALIDEELGTLRTLGIDGGDSREFESNAFFSWRRLGEGGPIVVALTRRDLAHSEHLTTRWYIALTSLGFCVLAVLIAHAVTRDFGDAIGALTRAADRVSAGDFTRAEVFESDDELGALGRHFDEMAAGLHSTIASLVQAADRVDQAGSQIGSAGQRVLEATDRQNRSLGEMGGAVADIDAQARQIAESGLALCESVAQSGQSVEEVASAGQWLDNSSRHLQEKVSDVSGSIAEMTERIREIAERTVEVAEASLQTTAGISRVAGALEGVKQSATDASRLTDDVVTSAEAGHEQVQKTIDGMHRIQAATRSAEEVIRGLGTSAARIGNILGVIDGIADETNLLALNAAIISAQAGEEGRAFSVVASGIKDLARSVQANTSEIADVIRDLQAQSERAVDVVAHGARSAEEGVALSNEAGNALQAISTAARASGEHSAGIVVEVRDQSEAASRLDSLMEQVSAGILQIRTSSQGQSENTELILQRTVEMGEVAGQLLAMTTDLSNSGQRIRASIEQVRGVTEGVEKAQVEQLRACAHASASLAGAQEDAGACGDAARGMAEAMQALQAEARTLRSVVAHFGIDAPIGADGEDAEEPR